MFHTVEVVGRAAIRDNTARKGHGPDDRFIDFLELLKVGLRLYRRDQRRLFPCQVSASLQSINTDVHESAATRKVRLETPLIGITESETEACLDHLHLAKGLLTGQSHDFLMVGLELTTIANGKLAIGFLTSRDHGFTIHRAIRHRLFTQDMLTGLRASDGELLVHRVWQNDIDDVNVRIIFDRIKVLVVVDALLGNPVFLRPHFLFSRRAGNNAGELAVIRLEQSGSNLVRGQTS